MPEKPKITTAEELAAKTPHERRQHFEDSIVRPDSLSDEQHEKTFARVGRVEGRS